MGGSDAPVQRATQEFVAELTRWRMERGLSKKQLAAAMGFDPSYVSHVEALRHRPTEDFARRAEAILQTGGTLWQRYKHYDDLRVGMRLPGRPPPGSEHWLPPGAGLVVEREIARLSYVEGTYRCTIRRALYNAGTEPVTQYPIRISVDRYPDDSDRSNRFYRSHPLQWDELTLIASCAGEPMHWRPKTDRDTFKEAWLLFENAQGRFPLYPGQRTTIVYTYHVGADKWGQWFQRSIRIPTRHLTVEVDFPAGMRAAVWGVETSLAAEAMPLRTPIVQQFTGDSRVVYSWQTDGPALHSRYRLEWRFRTDAALGGSAEAPAGAAIPRPVTPADDVLAPEPAAGRASERMRAVGILQRGADLLRNPVRRFDLPRDASTALDVTARLSAVIDRLDDLHLFTKGLGLAAPQLGLDWAAALVRPSEPGAEPVVLLNPRILAAASTTDDRFEGCLSFFDVRGAVPRPLWITVERSLPTGERVVERYEHALARLVAHEVDHLDGHLYVDRMAPGSQLVPVEEYHETGLPWRY